MARKKMSPAERVLSHLERQSPGFINPAIFGPRSLSADGTAFISGIDSLPEEERTQLDPSKPFDFMERVTRYARIQ